MESENFLFEKIHYLPVISLEKICLQMVMTELCNNPQLLYLIKNCKLPKKGIFRIRAKNGPKFAAIHAIANSLISQICKPAMLKKKLLELVWPISYKIMLWKSKYAPQIENEFLVRFYWTNRGKIDSIRTVRNIINNKDVSIRKRFVLACSVCLKKELEEIWREMSSDDKTYFVAGNYNEYRLIILLLVKMLKGTNDINVEDMKAAFECAAKRGLLEAVKYFLSIFTKDEKEESANYWVAHFSDKLHHYLFLEEEEFDILFILFFEQTVECQVKLFTYYSNLLLLLLYHRSNHNFFLHCLENRLHSMSGLQVAHLLYLIFQYYHLEVDTDNDYRKIFVDFWRMLPTSMKKKVKRFDIPLDILCILIGDHFPFLLEKGASKWISVITSPDLESRTSLTPFGFHQEKWEFMYFIIEEEIVTETIWKLSRIEISNRLKIRKSNKFALTTILNFMRKIRVKASLGKRINDR